MNNEINKKNLLRRGTAVFHKSVLSACTALALAGAAQAQVVEEEGGGERINFAGKLQMLSQRIGAAACYDHLKINSNAASIQLITASAEFTLILEALKDGSDQLDIFGTESDPNVLRELKALADIWEPMRKTIKKVVAVGGTDEEINLIGRESVPLFDKSKDVVTEVSIEYALPTSLLQADAIIIGIAGRQRSLAQNISMNACLLSAGLADDTAVDTLVAAMERYETSANALANGMPSAGVHPTDNPEILFGLEVAMAKWQKVKPTLEAIANGGKADRETLADIFATMNGLTSQMNSVVGDYTMDSKLDL